MKRTTWFFTATVTIIFLAAIFTGMQGSEHYIAKLHQNSIIAEFFLMGFMLSMALYHIVIASFIKRQRAFFYFAVFCIIMCVRIMITGERFVLDTFGWISWEMAQKLEYLTFYSALPIFLKFMDTLFENIFGKKMNETIYMITAVFIGLVLIFPAAVYTKSVFLYQLITLASGIYIVQKLYEAVKLRRTGSFEILIGFTLMLVLVTLEILGTNGYEGYTGYNGMTFWGVMIFFFSMAFGISKQFSLAFIQMERLATENKLMLGKIRKLNRALKKRNTELADKVSRDGLSGLYNHRHLHEKLHEKIEKAVLVNSSLSIGMFDIDRFKDVNDSYGHQFGDKVIVEVARILAENTRSRDIVGRYGGEEFMIIFDGVDSLDCTCISDRLREKVSQELKASLGISITISGGVVQLQQNEKADEIIQRADKLLYKAKENGRNRIECEKELA
ncbi:diguanylate cyclase AdrA (plasmid) [Peptoclostridium acidaminophilum DSM 3953]|uniref:Diguanylate cyclase AdrA n=1 Tax=Peptoclostridium acidaminophilum DSM 3953 TaxID=1286171 RepID=W8TKA8_PEPAC|nr:diguanylate cyclase [Peptoclostridium acidaminophilum]AHM58153.1 diguanylate cyclase AdrA [Peptoclostridium acidaminophilum DSM 3953]